MNDLQTQYSVFDMFIKTEFGFETVGIAIIVTTLVYGIVTHYIKEMYALFKEYGVVFCLSTMREYFKPFTSSIFFRFNVTLYLTIGLIILFSMFFEKASLGLLVGEYTLPVITYGFCISLLLQFFAWYGSDAKETCNCSCKNMV